jgi:hypothetical protein
MAQQDFTLAETSLRKALDLDGDFEAAHLLLAETTSLSTNIKHWTICCRSQPKPTTLPH